MRQGLGILVLGAGLSTRFDGPNKLLEPWQGRPLISHVLKLAGAIESHARVLVTHRDQDEIAALVPRPQDWRIVSNPDTQSGLASSLKLGLSALDKCEGVIVLLGDMPGVSLETVTAIVAAWTPDCYAIVPTFDEHWGNPVVLGAAAIAACSALTGDAGARKTLRANADKVLSLPVSDRGILVDFDRKEDWTTQNAL